MTRVKSGALLILCFLLMAVLLLALLFSTPSRLAESPRFRPCDTCCFHRVLFYAVTSGSRCWCCRFSCHVLPVYKPDDVLHLEILTQVIIYYKGTNWEYRHHPSYKQYGPAHGYGVGVVVYTWVELYRHEIARKLELKPRWDKFVSFDRKLV